MLINVKASVNLFASLNGAKGLHSSIYQDCNEKSFAWHSIGYRSAEKGQVLRREDYFMLNMLSSTIWRELHHQPICFLPK